MIANLVNDDDRKGNHKEIKFDFLGFTFRPRRSKSRYGKFFINFTPEVSNKAMKAMRQEIHKWRIHLKPDKDLEDLSNMFNPIIREWANYHRHIVAKERSKPIRP